MLQYKNLENIVFASPIYREYSHRGEFSSDLSYYNEIMVKELVMNTKYI